MADSKRVGIAVATIVGLWALVWCAATSSGTVYDTRPNEAGTNPGVFLSSAFSDDSCTGQLPGDLNGSGTINISDLTFLAEFLCAGGPPPALFSNADVNGDCFVDSSDIAYLANYLFGSGSPAPVPCTCVDPVIGGCTTSRLDCTRSLAANCLVACPAGDAPFVVYLRDQGDNPFVGSDDVWLDFTSCPGVVPCASETEWPIVRPAAPSDADGKVIFFVNAGGCAQGCLVEVRSSCGLIAAVPFSALDINGDLFVKIQDYDGTLCNDYNCSGTVDGTDLSLLAAHFGHSCASDPCDLVSHTLSLAPDTGLHVGDMVEARVEVQNGTTGTCLLDSVVLYESGFDVGGTPQRVTEVAVGASLGPGDAALVTFPYMIPGSGAGCVLARIFTSCCDSSSLAEYCVNVVRLDCPAPDSFEFAYSIVPSAPVYYKTLTSAMPIGFRSGLSPGDGWISAATTALAWVAIDQFATFGADASIVMLLCTDNTCSEILTRREFRVFYRQQRGDVNRDCAITSADIISLVNYVFKSGPPPLPSEEAGDVNCTIAVTSADIIYLVNYVFKGGDPPPETCN